MIRRVLAVTAFLALAACAGSYDYVTESAPAASAPPPPVAEAPAYVPPPPVQSAPLQAPAAVAAPPMTTAPRVTVAPPPPPPQETAPSIAAPNVAAPPPPRAPAPRGDIIVPGTVERQVVAPNGDPRSASERARDIRAWDDCVMQAQNAGEDDPMGPALDQPEDICRRQLGMARRDAIPDNRRR